MFVREMQFRLARGVPFCEIVQATAVQCLTLKTVTQMHLSLVFWIAIAVFVCYQIWIRNRDGAIVHAIRTTKAINAVMAAYRGGDYRTALQRAESLKDGSSNTAEYCFFRGSMLHHLGKLDDAESNLREGLALETDPRQRALGRGFGGVGLGCRRELRRGPRSRVLAGRSVPTLRHEEQADPRPVPLPCRKSLRSAQIAGEKSRAFSSSNRDRPSRKFRAARPGDGFIV